MSASQSSNPGSIASPASLQSQIQGKYNPRQSISFANGEHPFGSPFQYPQQSSPGFWSPQQILQQQGVARGGSPSLQNLGAIVPGPQDGYFPQGDVASQMQQRQQLLQNQLLQQQQLQLGTRAAQRLQEVSEIEEEEPPKSPSKTPEARQVKHNPSASLQKEIDDAEYHLEEQFQRQLEHDDYSPHSDHGDDESRFEKKQPGLHARNGSSMGGLAASRYATADDSEDGPILHHPQPHSRGHSLSQRPFQENEDTSSAGESKSEFLKSGDASKAMSDIETNPSNLGTPIPDLSGSLHSRALSTASNPWADVPSHNGDSAAARRSGHTSNKPSISKLNVGAKEFKFDPTSSFKPSHFNFSGSFSGNNFQPPVAAFSAFAPDMSTSSSHFSNHSINSGKSTINVGAPAFAPGHSEFNFSASLPMFRPDAPAFMPMNFSDSVGSAASGGDNHHSSLFGNIDLSALGISKPSKKSKAIPIVRPDSSHSKKVDETMEGNDGRITQAEGRVKRFRGVKDDADSVPLFAPGMPLTETSRGQSPPKETKSAVVNQADKENSAPIDTNGAIPDIPPKSDSRTTKSPSKAEETKKGDEKAQEPSKKAHKKNSLSATAKPFEFRPGSFSFTFGQPAQQPPSPVAAPSLPTSGGLAASKYARSPSPPPARASPKVSSQPEETSKFEPGPGSPPRQPAEQQEETPDREPTFEEIDAVMRQLNETEMQANSRESNIPRWQQPSPTRRFQVPEPETSSPIRLQPENFTRGDAPSPSPGRFHASPGETGTHRIFSRQLDDPFVGEYSSPVRRLNTSHSIPASDWDDVVSETEEAKIRPRAQFFDNHVNDLVGGLLDQRLDPLEKTLETIQMSLEMMAARAPSSRRERRSISGALSDADDEDDEEGAPRRSLSPRRDKKLEKIRAIVIEALSNHQSRPQTATTTFPDSSNVLEKLEEIKEQFNRSMHLDFRGDDLKNIVEEAVERRMPATPKPDESAKEAEYQARVAELEERLRRADATIDEEIKNRRQAEEQLAKVERQLHASSEEETRLRAANAEVALVKEAEFKSRITELEEKLGRAESKFEDETVNRRAAEDRLAEIQRQLRISSEEETRLRDAMEEREVKIREIVDESDAKVRAVEESRAKTAMKIAILEAAQNNASKTENSLQSRISTTESELRDAQKEVQRWQMEAERALEAARRHSEDAEQANETNKGLRVRMEALRTQMEESIRVREGMRGMLTGLQEDMARAARDMVQENAQRAKKEAELLARQEVLDAKLQAEARTRERLEKEIERLESGEREGMRAVAECKRLEALVVELRQESHNAQRDAMRHKREFEEARESGLSEVQRTRRSLQAEIESANNQVNVVREDLESQLSRLRADLDAVKLDADTASQKHDMLLEEAHTSKMKLLEDLTRKHANEMEDLQTNYERKLNNAVEDAQRSEQHLLERLSLSSSKAEHLQDRVHHLEEKLEIAKKAANAAAAHAKATRSASSSSSQPAPLQKTVSQNLELPEKISPQALRESIIVLQEQLQDREQKIEKLEATISSLDPESATKIQKRDDEILWLRELIAVRKSDLTELVSSLETENYDPNQVKDAAIRLRANLQMEEQERERAMNGGSALNLPNIAASLRDAAASPRVAQAVGPLAAAWGNWRKSRADSNLSEAGSTPRRNNSPGTQSFLGGLLTPPASSLRTPPSGQPTAFGSTGQRFTSAQLANRPRGGNMTPKAREKLPTRGASSGSAGPSTPPMMRQSSYDADARTTEIGEFASDTGFFDDEADGDGDEGSIYGGSLR